METAPWSPEGARNQTQAGTVLAQLLGGAADARNGTGPSRAPKPPDGTSAAWYIITIIGIYGVVFLFRLASNILRRSDKSLEEVYYSNLTCELKTKGLHRPAARPPSPASPGPNGANRGPPAQAQGVP